MKTSASVLAVLTLTGQLALAQTPADNDIKAEQHTVPASEQATQAETRVATDREVKSLERDLRPSLQNKLDAIMDFEMASRGEPLRAVASVD